jgi:cAMP phosphodiesterase
MTQIVRKSITVGNALPQYAVRLLDSSVLKSCNKTIDASIIVITELGDYSFNNKIWYEIPTTALKCDILKFEQTTKNMLKPMNFQGYKFI